MPVIQVLNYKNPQFDLFQCHLSQDSRRLKEIIKQYPISDVFTPSIKLQPLITIKIQNIEKNILNILFVSN